VISSSISLTQFFDDFTNGGELAGFFPPWKLPFEFVMDGLHLLLLSKLLLTERFTEYEFIVFEFNGEEGIGRMVAGYCS
jgi:hypothetical protein